MPQVDIVEATAESIRGHAFCGFRDPGNPGHRKKAEWLRKRFAEGLKFKVLRIDGEDAGMIEYVPGERAWRPIDADGYMAIHCVMIQKKAFKGRGYGSLLVEECLRDAKRAGMRGVAVVASGGTWMASPGVFLRCGFERADSAPPSFELLAKRFGKAPLPKFRGGWYEAQRKYGRGLTIVSSDQCPCIAKSEADILRACEEMRVPARVVKLKSCRQARAAPSPYGIFNVVLDGKLVAGHPISGTRFRNLMRKP